MPIVQAERVTKDYRLGRTTVPALRGVDLSVEAGEFLAIAGPSGSGKTTLLNLIGCIEQPTSGRILLHGEPLAQRSHDALADVRARQIGFIFQRFNLLPVLTSLENVEYPLLAQRLSAHERRTRAVASLMQVGLGKFLHHKPLELSGGQQQRVAIARATVAQPRLILADEPTANLDQATGHGILALMRQINQTLRTTFIFSTHDPKVMQQASRIVLLSDGLVAEAAA